MAIEFTCPGCSKHYSVEDSRAGSKTRCDACGTEFVVPAATADQAAPVNAPQADADAPTLGASADHATPPAVAPTLDANIQRSGLTITEFMAKHGIEGGVRLHEDEGRVSGVEGERPRDPGSAARAPGILTDEQGRKYRVGTLVAKGGMGAILSVKDLNVRRTVAMKVMLHPEKVTEQQVLRFIEEAQVTGQLEHPGIVPVYELGVDAGENVFYTMKLLHGITLKDILYGIADGNSDVIGAYPLNRLLTVFQKVCDAMAFAHARGVIHRDLKPENIMVGDFGEVLVMDWGLAKVLVRDEGRGSRLRSEATPRHAGVEGEEQGKGVSGKGQGQDTAAGSSGAAAAAGDPATGLGGRLGAAQSRGQNRVGSGESLDAPRRGSGGSAPAVDSIRADVEVFKTVEGQVMGTPSYMAPEQALGKIDQVGARTDIYALGGILYTILTLRPPVSGENVGQVLLKVVRGEITPPIAFNQPSMQSGRRAPRGDSGGPARSSVPRGAGRSEETRGARPGTPDRVNAELPTFPHLPGGAIPPPLSAVAMKALALDPANRYQAVKDLQADIERYQTGFATSAEHAGLARHLVLLVRRHRGFVTAAAAVVLALVLGLGIALAQWRKAVVNERQAVAAQHAEAEQRRQAVAAKDAETRARIGLERENYFNTIMIADVMIREGNIDGAMTRLWNTPQALRHWEWGYLVALCHRDFLSIEGPPSVPNLSGLSGKFSPDGTRILLTDSRPTGGVFDAVSGARIQPWPSPVPIKTAVPLPDGKRVLCIDINNLVAVWDLTTDRTTATYAGHTKGKSVCGVKVSPDGRRAATEESVGDSFLTRVWDTETGRDVLTSAGEPAVFRGWVMAFAAGGGRLVINAESTEKLMFQMWDIDTAKLVWEVPGVVLGCAVSPDGSLLAWGTNERNDHRIRMLHANTGEVLYTLDGHCGVIPSVAFSPDGTRLVSASVDGTVRVWDLAARREVLRLAGQHQDGVRSAKFSPDGRLILTTGYDEKAKLWSLTDPPGPRRLPVYCEGPADVSPDGRLLLTGHPYGLARLWRLPSGEHVANLVFPSTGMGPVSFSPDGRRMVTSGGKTVWIWDVTSCRKIQRLDLEFRTDGQVAFSPDGQRVAGAGRVRETSSTRARVWDVLSGKELLTFDNASNTELTVGFSPDGRFIVTMGRLLDATSGRDVVALQGIKWAGPLALSTDGRRLAYFDRLAGETLIFDMQAREIQMGLAGQIGAVPSVAPLAKLTGHSGEVEALAFSPDGRRLVETRSSAKKIRIWDTETWREVLDIEEEDPGARVQFSPDGRSMITVGQHVIVREALPWDITPDGVEEWKRERYAQWRDGGIPQPQRSDATVPPSPGVQSKAPATFVVPRVKTAITIDGVIRPEEWAGANPADAMPIEQDANGEKVAPGSLAWLTHNETDLFIAVDNTLAPDKTASQHRDWGWGPDDAVGITICSPVAGGGAPVLVLHGYACGRFECVQVERSQEAGAPGTHVDHAAKGVEFKTSAATPGRWTAEWRIPFASLGIDPTTQKRFQFNLTVRKVAVKDPVWIEWQGTGCQSWSVENAGVIELGQ